MARTSAAAASAFAPIVAAGGLALMSGAAFAQSAGKASGGAAAAGGFLAAPLSPVTDANGAASSLRSLDTLLGQLTSLNSVGFFGPTGLGHTNGIGPISSNATTYTFKGPSPTTSLPANGNFSGLTSFSPSLGVSASTIPYSTSADTLAFGGGSASYTASDDFTSPVNLQTLSIVSTGSVVVTLGATSGPGASNTLAFSNTTSNAINLNNTTAASIALNLALSGPTSVSGTGSATLGGVISGSGSLLKLSAGDLALYGANTFMGGTTLTAGRLLIDNNSALGTGTLSLAGGQIRADNAPRTLANPLAINGSFSVGQATTFTGNATLGANVTITEVDPVSASYGYATFGGVLSGNYGVTFATAASDGSGIINLNGANTYTGSTNISSGTLTLGNSLALQNSTLAYNTGGGALSFGTLTAATLGNLSGTKNLALTNTASTPAAVALTIGGNGASQYDGILSGNGSLIKAGTGTSTLTGANTYTGGTTITNGELSVGADYNLGTGGVTLNGGMLQWTGGSETFGRPVRLVSGTAIATSGFDITNAATNFTIGSVLAGSGYLYKTGSGTLTLTGVGSNTGVYAAFTNGTTVVTGASSATYASLAVNGGVEITGNATLTVSGASSSGTPSSINTGSSGYITIGAGGTGTLNLTSGGSVTTSYGYIGSGAGNVGTVTVSGTSNGVSSLWNLSDGFLAVGVNGSGILNITNGGKVTTGTDLTRLSNGSTSSSSLIINGGSLTSDYIVALEGSAPTIKLTNPTAANGGGYALNLGNYNGSTTINSIITDAAAGDGASGSIAGGPGGAGGIDKVGSGFLELDAANTFSGGMQIDGGYVGLGNSLALQNSIAILNVNNGLDFNGLTAATLGGISGSGNLDLINDYGSSTFALTVGGNNASTTYAGTIYDIGSLSKAGTGILTLTGANTYTGGTTIGSGTLQLGNGTSSNGSVAGNIVDNASLIFANPSSQTYDGSLSGAGILTKTGAGTLTLTGISSFTSTSNTTGTVSFNNGTTLITGATSSGATGYASLTSGLGSIGRNVGDNGTVNVSGMSSGGVASSWNTGARTLFVGYSGTGALNITNGGNVSTNGNTYMGYYSGSSGAATVSGASSSGVASSWNSKLSLTVGLNGTATLSITDGGIVNSGQGVVGFDTGSVGTALVSGTGNSGVASSWNMGTHILGVGVDGTGTLNIMNGGSVASGGGGVLGYMNGGNGVVTVSGMSGNGVASSWDTGTVDGLFIGEGAVGTLNITNGGSVVSGGGGDIGTNNAGVGNVGIGTVNVSGTSSGGGASSWNTGTTYPLDVGDGGTGTLNITNGGVVTSTGSGAGGDIGYAAGSVGVATVSGVSSGGVASFWNNDGGDLYVGDGGAGTLNITNGGIVRTGAGMTHLSNAAGSSASLIINGGSLTTSSIVVGSGSTPTVKLTNPTAANGGGYALNIGGTGSSSTTLGMVIADAASGDGASANGSIAGGPGGAGGIRKTGSGTLTLTATNTFSGGVQIDAGTVVASGTALGMGATRIASGATLSVGEAPNTTGSAITPQSLSASSLAVTLGSTTPLLTFNLGASGMSDMLKLTSSSVPELTFSGAGAFDIGFASATGSALGAGTYTLITLANPEATTSAPAIGSYQAVAQGNLARINGGSFAYRTDGSSKVTGLNFTISGSADSALPEPSALALFALGMLGGLPALGIFARRRAQSETRL